VPHFRDRFTCVTFSHRGFSPSSAPAGGPDPQAYGDDLAALMDHLGASDVRIVAQSMGGWGALDYALANPARVRALVLASTGGSMAWPAFPFAEPDRILRWRAESETASAALFARGIHPAGGERMAREQPALNYLYRAIDALSAGLDKTVLRGRLMASLRHPVDRLRTLDIPTLWLTGAEDLVFPPFVADTLAPLMPTMSSGPTTRWQYPSTKCGRTSSATASLTIASGSSSDGSKTACQAHRSSVSLCCASTVTCTRRRTRC
jgi:pimeloyl-ACP methyl ester carboxylesterase